MEEINKFKTGLMSRLFSEASRTMFQVPVAETSAVQTAGAIVPANKVHPTQGFNIRAFIRLYVLFFAMYLAAFLITSSIVKDILKAMKIDIDKINSDEEDAKKKYLVVVLTLVIFLALTALLDHLIMRAIYWCIFLYYDTGSAIGESAEFLAKLTYRVWFDEYGTKYGEATMGMYVMMSKFALIGMGILMVLYLLFVKSYLERIDYPEYAPDKGEHSNQRKFLLLYALTVIYIMLFMIGLFTVFEARTNIVIIGYTLIMLFGYALGATGIVHLTLKKKYLWTAIIALILLGFVLANFSYAVDVGAS